ncbi:MAG: hypothetical protein Q4G07_05975 [Oscillospiraceae bacterium]|nr:hypothetical protein [Oscillospiraceae bacterium]
MELFFENGCLSDAALAALTQGGLDTPQRLAAAEHLSVCDDCLLRYLQLQAAPSPPPPQGMEQRLLTAVRHKRLRLFVKRAAPAAAAACFAVVFTLTGFITKPPDMSPVGVDAFRAERSIVSAASQTAQQYKNAAGPLLESLFHLDFLKGAENS